MAVADLGPLQLHLGDPLDQPDGEVGLVLPWVHVWYLSSDTHDAKISLHYLPSSIVYLVVIFVFFSFFIVR